MRTLIAGLSITLATGCFKELPPPATPEQVMPNMQAYATEEPPPGTGSVAIVADEPSLVEQVTGTYEGVTSSADIVSGFTYATICARTPCVANLPLGAHDLRLTSLADPNHNGTGSVTIGAQATNYRYALGHNQDHISNFVWGANALAWGLAGIGGGGALYLAGSASDGSEGKHIGGVAFMVGGAALAVLGIVLMKDGVVTSQAGAGVQW